MLNWCDEHVANCRTRIVSYLVQGRQKHRKYVFNEIEKYCEMYIARGEANEEEMLSNDRNVRLGDAFELPHIWNEFLSNSYADTRL
jgi:hypothetical protein